MLLDFDFHSPEQEVLLPLYQEKGIRVFFKRDDMIHPFISGNKWRKLKYNLLKAKEMKKKKLVTFGGAWSNHLLACACAGATFGFQTAAYVRGEDVQNPVLDMCKLFGMQLHFVSREEYRNKELLINQMPTDNDCYFIAEGGAGEDAAQGCAEIIHELKHTYDHIVCAAGTGTTVAGLAKGIDTNHLSAKLHIVPVLKQGSFIRDEMLALGAPVSSSIFHLDYHFGGYAKTKPHLIDFIKAFVSTTGIMIEPTYSGKAVFALNDLIQQEYFPRHSRILYLHTGGLTGLLGMLDKF